MLSDRLLPCALGGDVRTTSREVFHADAMAWLVEHGPLHGSSIVTSLPDSSELPRLSFCAWQDWFVSAASLVVRSIPREGIAVFFQSDVLHAGLWVDKAAMIAEAGRREGADLLFHTIVCRKAPGSPTFGRASYAHMLGFSRGLRLARRQGRVDVLPNGGTQPGAKSMGALACRDACLTVLGETQTRTVVDPFCGFGTVLAVANALGLDSVGIDVSARMCRKARSLTLSRADIEGVLPSPTRQRSAT